MDCVAIRNAAIAAGAMTLVDIVTGVTRAALNRELSSDGWLRGLGRKAAIVLAFALAVALEYAETLLPMGLDIRITIPVACYLVLTEATSAETISTVAWQRARGRDVPYDPSAYAGWDHTGRPILVADGDRIWTV